MKQPGPSAEPNHGQQISGRTSALANWWPVGFRLKARNRHRVRQVALSSLLFFLAYNSRADQREFVIDGTTFSLQEVTSEVAVYYQFMRFNRATGNWNVDVYLASQSTRVFNGPVVLSIESYSGTTGPLQPDGFDNSTPAKAFYDLSFFVNNGSLAPGQRTAARTISIGFANGAPSLTSKVYVQPSLPGVLLALTRSLNEAGQPLPGVQVVETGPQGLRTNLTDATFGVITLGQAPGGYVWQFTAPDYLPAWLQQTLTSNGVTELPAPRLVRRAQNTFNLTPIGGGLVTNADASVQINFSPASFTQNATATLTPLTGQTLPALLPQGWSPLQAFWLELKAEPTQPGSATLIPWGAIDPNETAVLARFDTAKLQWIALQTLPGNRTNALIVALPGSGAYSLIIGDSPPLAPPVQQIGRALAPSTASAPDFTLLKASGAVEPTSSPASLVPELVTAAANITITNQSGNLSSGTLLRCQVKEEYRLRDGTPRVTPQYENFIVTYARPGDRNPSALHASFPMRPLLLLGAEELDRATISVDVLAPAPFAGGVLDSSGGEIASGNMRILAGSGDIAGTQAIELHLLNPTNFMDLAGSNFTILQAFDLSLTGLAPGRHLTAQFNSVPTNALFVLAKVLTQAGMYGLQPIERLASDATGKLRTLEPASGDRLPGLVGAGEYVLVQIQQPLALVSGTARASNGQATGGLPVRITAQPWLAVSAIDGTFRLLAAVGNSQLVLTDPQTGDIGQTTMSVLDPQVGVTATLSALSAGPSVVSVTPAPGATAVSRVTSIVVRFSKALNAGSLGTAGIQLLDTNGQPVAASLTLDLANTLATLLPIAQLDPSTTYTLVLSTKLADATGRLLQGTNTFGFTTASDSLNRGLGAQVISYEPTNGLARMEGTQGIADPGAPVILVNETSGRTTTVLSNPNGSFSGTLQAAVDDVLSVVFVNQNGTRNTVPVSRQVFSDGSVGLFHGGGVLEAQSDNGPMQLIVEPGAISTKTKFKLEPLPLAEITSLLSNAPPELGKVLGGFKYSAQGDEPTKTPDVVFPVKLQDLGLPPGVDPTNASFALTVPQEIDGVRVYEIIDHMQYEAGKLVTHSLPFLGLLGPFEDVLIAPLVLSVGNSLTVAGSVRAATLNTNAVPDLTTARALPGALVTFSASGTFGPPGRLSSGAYMCTARGAGASFSIMIPATQFDPLSSAVAMRATHPRFPGTAARRTIQLPTPEERLAIGNVLAPADLVFVLSPSDAKDTTPPKLTISNAPLYPQPGGTSEVRVVAFDDFSLPNVKLAYGSATSVAQGVTINASDVSISPESQEILGSTVMRSYFNVSCTKTGVVVLTASATDAAGNVRDMSYPISFGGAPPTGNNSIPASDPNDTTGPTVISTSPAQASTGLAPGQPITLRFSKPIDKSILQNPYFIDQQPFTSLPAMQLSDDQQELSLVFHDLVPNTEYTLTATPNITDLRGNHLDQDPTTREPDSFELSYRTAPRADGTLAGIQLGGGVVSKGIFAYALERRAAAGGSVVVYDMSNPSAPNKVTEFGLPGSARDLALIPHYSFKRSLDGPVETKDLLAVVGGDIGSAVGQFLWVLDVSDPTSPKRLASRQVTLSPSSAVIKVMWSPPMLAYLELSDVSSIGLVNLQAFILGELLKTLTPGQGLPFPPDGTPGLDLNGDGDYVDPGEQLPYPRTRGDFAGKVFTYTLPDTDQSIIDFSIEQGGNFIGLVVDAGHVLDTNGIPSSQVAPAAYRTLYSGLLELPGAAATFVFTNARPTRVTTLFNFPLLVNGQFQTLDLALVSVTSDIDNSNRLAVLDISLPTDPRLVAVIPVPTANGGPPYSVVKRDDGLLLLATPQDILILDPNQFGAPNPNSGPPPALVGVIPNSGSGSFNYFGSSDGLNGVNQGGNNRVIQIAPSVEFVSFPNLTPFAAATWVGLADQDIKVRLDGLKIPEFLSPSRFRTAGCATSTLDPPQALNHYYVLVHAPGSAGATIDLALESLNWSQQPLAKKGFLFPPVNAFGEQALSQLDQTPTSEDAPVRAGRAWRLSSNPASEYYNYYLSRPLVLVYEELSRDDLAALESTLDRDILWSGDYTRVGLDPSIGLNTAIGRFAGSVDTLWRAYRPGVSAEVPSFPADYLQSPNPGPVTGWTMLPGTLNAISAHSGELVINAVDMELPGRRLQLTFRRNYSAQCLYDGPFGRGWDFNFNQRIVELKASLFPTGSRLPLVVRKDPSDSECGGGGDLLFYSGAGRVVLYSFAGTNAPPEVAADPLVQHLCWITNTARYYLPPSGAFNLIFKFRDSRFARLEPDGTQYWYNSAGRLIKVYDRYEKNSLEMIYNPRGELIQILDELRRPLNIGYWRLPNDPDQRPLIDEVTTQTAIADKICRLLDYSKRDVLFYYTADGLLDRREGPLVETGVTNSFFGRQVARYNYTDASSPDRSAKSLLGMVGGDAGGSPLVTATELGSHGRDTVSKFKIGTDTTTISLSYSNSAENLSAGNGHTTLGSSTGLITDHQFDKFGRPIQTLLIPPTAPALTNQAEYFTNGLLKSVTAPEGNRTEFVYDSTNPSLRARANLIKVTRYPGPRGGAVLEATTEFDGWYNLPAGTRTDFNGNIITIVLTGDHRDTLSITKGTDTESFVANEFGQMTSHTMLDGIVTSSAYNSDGFLSQRSVGPLVTIYGYANLSGLTSDPGLRGLASTVVDPKGITTTQLFDERNQLAREDRAGVTRTLAYDVAGHVIESTTSVDTNRVLIEDRTYNQFGFMTSSTVRKVEVDGMTNDLVTTYVPDQQNRVKEIFYPSGDHHVMDYDDFARLVRYTVLGAYSESYGYDRNGNQVSKTIGKAAEFNLYDGHDRLIRHVTPLGTTVDLSLDGNGNLLGKAVRDKATNILSQYSYSVDALDRYRSVTQAHDSGSSTMTYTYTSTNRSVALVDALGAQAITFYDSAGRAERMITPTRTNLFSYDPNGNLIQKQITENGQTYTQTYDYNDRDQRTKEMDNLGNSSTMSVGLDGRLLGETDREGHITTHAYSLFGEPLGTVNPNGVAVQFSLNTNRQPDSIKDTANNTLANTYDAPGRLLQVALPDGAVTTYTNFNEQLLPQTVKMPRGITMQSAFDLEGKITNRVITGFGPSRAETYQYDGLQRPVQVTDPSGSVGYQYDLFGFIKEYDFHYQFQSNLPPVNTLDFTLRQDADAGGFRSVAVYPGSSVTVTNRRDSVGRLVALLLDAGEPVVQDTVYVGDHLIGRRILGSSRLALEMAFDGIERPIIRRYTRISDGRVVAEVRYAFDKNGAQLARQFLHRAGRTDFLSYDAGYRLVRADLGVRPGVGNAERGRSLPGFALPSGVAGSWAPGLFARVMSYTNTDVLHSVDLLNPDNLSVPPMASVYGDPDTLLFVPQIDGFARSRDEVGNVTSARLAVRIPGSASAQLVSANLYYDDLGLLVRIERTDGVSVANEFNPAGLRIRRHVTGDPTRCVPSDTTYLYDGSKLIETRDLLRGAAITARFFYGDDGDELIAGDFSDASGTNLARHYFLTDAVKSVMALTDSSGQVIERASYDAWGEPVIQAADNSPPAVARVFGETNTLLIEFTESVLPSFAATNATGLITALIDPDAIFELRAGGQPVSGKVFYEETLAGHQFGSVFRFIPDQPVNGTVQLTLNGGAVQDEWNNTNASAVLNLDLSTPSGTPLFSGPAPGSTAPVELGRSSVNSPFLFHGQVFDYETGLVYCRARFYDPVVGMFLQRDPAGYGDGVNHYAGFANNPVNFRDPNGTAVSWSDLGRTLESTGAEMKGSSSILQYLFGTALEVAGSPLMISTTAGQGMELLESHNQGTFGLLDRLRGANMVANAGKEVFGLSITVAAIGDAAYNSAYGYVSSLAEKRAAAKAARQRATSNLYREGMGDLEPESFYRGMQRFKEEQGATTIEVGIRDFGEKAEARRRNANAGEFGKGVSIKKKTEDDAHVRLYFEDPKGFLGPKEHGPRNIWTSEDKDLKSFKDFNSDLDLYYVRIDGRRANLRESQRFGFLVNQEYSKAFKNAGFTGRPNVPIFHGAHVNLPELYGSKFNGSLVDNAYLEHIGHPGAGFSIRLNADGSVTSWDASRSYLQGLINEADPGLRRLQGYQLWEPQKAPGLPNNWRDFR